MTSYSRTGGVELLPFPVTYIEDRGPRPAETHLITLALARHARHHVADVSRRHRVYRIASGLTHCLPTQHHHTTVARDI
jgi:hypothetical protein